MAEPYVQVFTLPPTLDFPRGVKHTSVVLDKEEFDALVDSFAAIEFTSHSGNRMTAADVESFKKAGFVPMIGRGAKTAFIFEKYGVTTDTMGMVVRGIGKKMVGEFLGT